MPEGEVRIMAKKRQQSLFDFLDKVIDEGATEEIDMQKMGHKLLGRALNLTGKVKFHIKPFKKREGR